MKALVNVAFEDKSKTPRGAVGGMVLTGGTALSCLKLYKFAGKAIFQFN